jgi:hypothetical protein
MGPEATSDAIRHINVTTFEQEEQGVGVHRSLFYAPTIPYWWTKRRYRKVTDAATNGALRLPCNGFRSVALERPRRSWPHIPVGVRGYVRSGAACRDRRIGAAVHSWRAWSSQYPACSVGSEEFLVFKLLRLYTRYAESQGWQMGSMPSYKDRLAIRCSPLHERGWPKNKT